MYVKTLPKYLRCNYIMYKCYYFKQSFLYNSLTSAFCINPLLAEFLKWNNPPSIFGTVHYQLCDMKVSQPTVKSLSKIIFS